MKDANTQPRHIAPDSADDRWSRFREAATCLIESDQWPALEAIWSATGEGSLVADDLPCVVEWKDLQPGDLARDVMESDCDLLLVLREGEETRGRWHVASGAAATNSTYALPLCIRDAEAPRAVLIARNVSEPAAIRQIWTHRPLPPEIEAEARRPAP